LTRYPDSHAKNVNAGKKGGGGGGGDTGGGGTGTPGGTGENVYTSGAASAMKPCTASMR